MNSKKELLKALICIVCVMFCMRLVRILLMRYIEDTFLLNLILQFLFAAASILSAYGIMHYRNVLRFR